MTASQTLWRKALVPASATLQEVIQNLVESGLLIALAVSADGVLQGTVTDGDIRRGLLRGMRMDDPIESIVHRQPLVVTPELDRDQIMNLMRANRIHQLPVVDDAWRVLGLHLLEELDQPIVSDHVMLIMAGGRGTRLMPLTRDCPKPMLPVAGKPMLEHILLRARAEGFARFILAVNYLSHQIEAYFGQGESWGVRIDYLREEQPLGTAGALALLAPAPEKPFIVTNGDVMTDIRYADLLDFHQRHQAGATMAVRPYEWQLPFGVVNLRGVEIVAVEEKPVHKSYVNAGIYVIEPDALACLDKGARCDMPHLFERLRSAGHSTVAYPMHEPWLDVGRPDDLQKAHDRLGVAPHMNGVA